MKCPHCQSTAADDAKFCPICGKAITSAGSEQTAAAANTAKTTEPQTAPKTVPAATAKEKKGTSKLGIIIAIVAIVLVLAVAAVLIIPKAISSIGEMSNDGYSDTYDDDDDEDDDEGDNGDSGTESNSEQVSEDEGKAEDNGDTDNNGGADDNGNNDGADSTPTLGKDPSSFEDGDFGGDEFKFLYHGSSATDYYDEYIWSDSASGTAISEAAAERNKQVEDKYNVTITAEECAPIGEAITRMQAGQCDFDVIYEWGIGLKSAAVDGMLYDFHELDGLDLEASYWVPSAVEGLTVADRMFVTTNMVTMNSLAWADIYFFNKMLMDDIGYDYPYAYVDNGTWTYDALIEMIQKAEKDVNGDNIMDTNDRFGGISGSAILGGLCDAPLVDENSDGTYTLITYTEDMVGKYNTYKTMLDSISHIDYYSFAENADISGFPSQFVAARFLSFGEDHYLFFPGSVAMASEFKDMKSDYGVVPTPVVNPGDEYSSGVDYCAPMFSMPIQLEDPEMAAMVFDYMAYESERLLLPAFYETTIKTKRMEDTRDYDMLDIVRDSVKYDWTGIYMWGSDLGNMRSSMLSSGKFASVAKRYGPSWQDELDTLIDTLSSLG